MENRPFWNFMINFPLIKWFCNLNISKNAMQHKLIQKIFNYEMITYIFFGVATTVLNWICYFLLCKAIGIPMNNPSTKDAVASNIANSLAFIISLIFAFVTNKLIVFKSKTGSFKYVLKEFLSFTVARLLTFGLETVILTVAAFIHFNLMISKIFSGILVVILNYVFSKLFIFKNKEEKGV